MKVLIVSQYAQPTGFSRVTRLMAASFATMYETHVLGIDCYTKIDEKLSYRVHANTSSLDVFAEQALVTIIDEVLPDVVVLYHDAWLMHRFLIPMRSCHHQCCKVGYIPIDGYILRPYVFEDMAELDALVAFTSFGRDILVEGMSRFEANQMPPVAIIPHGINSCFFPLNSEIGNYGKRRQLARRHLFANDPSLWTGFWVLNANKNQPRKRLDITVEGFALFARNKPEDVKLFLHSSPNSRHLNTDQLAASLGIADRIICAAKGNDQPYFPESFVNLVYNACDVGINTSTGEGWGLVSIEHAATGAPQIVPDHSACREIWEQAASLLPVRKECYGNGMLIGGEVDATDVAEALEKLYSDRSYYHERMLACFENSWNPQFTMTEIVEKWSRLFLEITSCKFAML